MKVMFDNISSQTLKKLRENALPLLLLLLLTAATYWEVATHSILANWDDHIYITHNPAIRGFSLENFKAAFTGYYVGNYAPVQIISYMLDDALWGDKPPGWFLANISYHFISAVFLYFLLLRFGFWKWGAFFGAAVFLTHPLQVETVAWLSQRKNLLAMLSCLLAFHGYLSYLENDGKQERRWYYLLSLSAFVLALLSKSVAVIFPVMLVMYDVLVPSLRRNFLAQRDKIPFIAAAAIVAAIAMISQEGAQGGGRIDYPPNALVTLPLTMLPVLVRYLNLLFCPLPSLQSVMYFPPLRSELDPIVIMSLGIVATLLAAAVYLYRKNRPCLFWYGLFFLGLLPVSQIVPLVTMMNDRYMYFPMLGAAGLIASLATSLHERTQLLLWGKALLVMACGIVIILSAASYQRGKVWKNSITLFSDAVAKYPEQMTTWARLAEGYVAAGDLAIAQHYYEKAALFDDLDGDARHNLAKIYLMGGEYDKAYQQIWSLLQGGDSSSVIMLLLGEYNYRIGSYSEAEQQIMSYLDEYPTDSNGLYLLGRVYFSTGNNGAAREFYNRAITEGSVSPDLFYSFACLEAIEGYPEPAFAYLTKAFEYGLTSRNMHDEERCLAELKGDQRLRQMIREQLGE